LMAAEPWSHWRLHHQRGGSAIVDALGPIRQCPGEGDIQRRYLVIPAGNASQHGAPVCAYGSWQRSAFERASLCHGRGR
jgi:hypothetical protein